MDRANNRRFQAGFGSLQRHPPSDLSMWNENLHKTVIKYWINIIVLITSHIWEWKAIFGEGNDKINKFAQQTLSAFAMHKEGEYLEFVFLSPTLGFPAHQRNDDFMRMLWAEGGNQYLLWNEEQSKLSLVCELREIWFCNEKLYSLAELFPRKSSWLIRKVFIYLRGHWMQFVSLEYVCVLWRPWHQTTTSWWLELCPGG